MGNEQKQINHGKRTRWLGWVSLMILSLADFIVRVFRNSIGTLAGSLSETFQVGDSALGNLSSLYFFPYMLMQIPTGYLADVLGIRIVISMGMALTCAGGLLFGLAPNITILYIARLMIGFGVSAPVVCIQRFISAWYDESRQGTMSGIQSLIGSFGSVFAQAPMALLVQYFTWRMTIVGVSVFTLALSVSALLFLRDSPDEVGNQVNRALHRKAGKKKSLVTTFSAIYKNRYVWPLLVILFLHMSVNAVFSSTYAVPYLRETFGFTNVKASSFTTIQAVGQMFGGIIAGPISDRLQSRKKVIIILAGLSMWTWIMLVFGTRLMQNAFVMGLVMLINGLVYYQTVMVFFSTKEVNDPEFTGSSVSAVNMVGMLGSTLAPKAAGSAMDYFAAKGISGAAQYHATFMIFMLAAVIMFVMTFFVKETNCKNCYRELFNPTKGGI